MAEKLSESYELNEDQSITYPNGVLSSSIVELIRYFTDAEVHTRPADALLFQQILENRKITPYRFVWKSYQE